MRWPYSALSKDRDGQPMQEFTLPQVAINTSSSEAQATSSVIGLNPNAVTMEIGAFGAGAAVKWITTSDTTASVISAAGTANFDFLVPPNMIRRVTIPIEQFVASSSVQGANRMNGLYQRVAIKSVGAASVLTTQYSPS